MCVKTAPPGKSVATTEEETMLISTAPTVEGQRITAYHGIVSGDAILGANVFKDVFAGIRDIVGGRSAAYEKELKSAKKIALQEIEAEAEALGARRERRRRTVLPRDEPRPRPTEWRLARLGEPAGAVQDLPRGRAGRAAGAGAGGGRPVVGHGPAPQRPDVR